MKIVQIGGAIFFSARSSRATATNWNISSTDDKSALATVVGLEGEIPSDFPVFFLMNERQFHCYV